MPTQTLGSLGSTLPNTPLVFSLGQGFSEVIRKCLRARRRSYHFIKVSMRLPQKEYTIKSSLPPFKYRLTAFNNIRLMSKVQLGSGDMTASRRGSCYCRRHCGYCCSLMRVVQIFTLSVGEKVGSTLGDISLLMYQFPRRFR